jgi:hypothetical protein
MAKWQSIPGQAETIAIGDDNTLWAANRSRSIIFAQSVSTTDPGWRSLPGLALQIDGKSKDLAVVVGTNPVGPNFGIYGWTNNNWRDLPSAGTWISIGSDGIVYYNNSNGDLYVDEKSGRGWQLAGRNVAQVAVGNKNNVWIVDKQQRVFRKSDNTWAPVPGQLTRVAVSGDGSKVVGVNNTDDVFAWDGKAWQQIPGKLRNISVNKTYIVGANSQGAILMNKISSTA